MELFSQEEFEDDPHLSGEVELAPERSKVSYSRIFQLDLLKLRIELCESEW